MFKGSHIFISKLIEDFYPDIIAVHGPKPRVLKCLNRFHIPIVVWIHGAEVLITGLHNYIPPFGIRNNVRKILSSVIALIRNLALRHYLQKVNAIVYVSKWMNKMSNRYLLMNHPHSFVIPNPVDTNLFKPINLNDKLGIPEVISVRSLEWKYGIDIAIRAFTKSKIKLKIIGKGSLMIYLKNLARTLNANVEFIMEGIEHSRLPGIYSNFMFFVAPSRTEAQGVSMCEAMACGLPVIATNVGGIPEFVINDYNGLLVPSDDPISLRRAVMKIINNKELYNTLSENARKFVVENLSHEIIFNKELKVLTLAIEQSS